MKLKEAQEIANWVREKLLPHCLRCEIAGSIRREKPEVGDIEIVAIPKPYNVGLFESGIATIVEQWQKIKGTLPCKYTQRLLPQGVTLDLFFAKPENWGLIFAIRTGSDWYSHYVLANGWSRKGYVSIKGILHIHGIPICVKEEIDLFKLIGITYEEPRNRKE